MERGYWSRQALSRRRVLRGAGLGLAGLAGAALIGCGDDDDDQPAATATGTGTAQASGTTQPSRAPGAPIDIGTAPVYTAKFPEKSSTLTDFHWSTHPDRLNPQVPKPGGVAVSEFYGSSEHSWVASGNQGSAAMAALCNNMVLSIDYGVFADNDLLDVTARNALAESWEQTEDGLEYVFHFRPNVKWQNVPPVNGRAFTAEDVKYAWDVLSSPESAQRAIFQDIASIDVVDDLTIKVTMARPFAAFLKGIAAPYASIFSREQFEGPDALSKTTIGTGPFIEQEFDAAEGATYVKNPDYFMIDEFGQRLPYLDALLDINIADSESARAAFVAKEIDDIVHFRIARTEDMDRMRQQVPEHGLQVWPPNGTFMYLLHFNQANPLLDDVRVRRAMSMGMDRVNTFIDTVFNGSATTAGYLVHTYMGNRFPLTPDELGPYFQFNPAEARKLLDAAGAPDPLKLEVMNSSGSRGTFVEGVQPDYREAGIDLDLRTVEGVAAVNAYFSREWKDLHTWSQVTVHGNDQDGWAYERYHSQSPQNSGGYNNPTIDDLAEKQRLEFDLEARQEIWQDMHKILLDDIPLIVAGGTFEPVMWHSYFHEFTDNFVSWMLSWAGTQFQNVWFDDRAPSRSVKQLVDDPKGFVKQNFKHTRLVT